MDNLYFYIEPQLLEILEKTWAAINKNETIKILTDIKLAEIAFLFLTDALCSYWKLIGKYEEAIKWLNRAIDIAREQNNKRLLHSYLKNYSHIYVDQGKADLALQYSKEALELSDQLGIFEKIEDLMFVGACYTLSGEGEKALYWLEKAQKIVSKVSNAQQKGILLDHMGNAYIALKQIDKAISCYEESVRLAQHINDSS
jgi:tetratricopeptide (TPR) repeat protein